MGPPNEVHPSFRKIQNMANGEAPCLVSCGEIGCIGGS
jgi:hypothetical protein